MCDENHNTGKKEAISALTPCNISVLIWKENELAVGSWNMKQTWWLYTFGRFAGKCKCNEPQLSDCRISYISIISFLDYSIVRGLCYSNVHSFHLDCERLINKKNLVVVVHFYVFITWYLVLVWFFFFCILHFILFILFYFIFI